MRYLRHDTNRNFAGACNAGARLAQAPLTFFLNNDAYPLGDALTPLAAALRARRGRDRRRRALLRGRRYAGGGARRAAQRALALLLSAILPATLAAVRRSRDALGVSGAAMAVRTGWFVESGGFDESFVNGFEDVDLCMRAREQGRAIAYVARGALRALRSRLRRALRPRSRERTALLRALVGELGAAAAHGARRGRRDCACAARARAARCLRRRATTSRRRCARSVIRSCAATIAALATPRPPFSARRDLGVVLGRDPVARHCDPSRTKRATTIRTRGARRARSAVAAVRVRRERAARWGCAARTIRRAPRSESPEATMRRAAQLVAAGYRPCASRRRCCSAKSVRRARVRRPCRARPTTALSATCCSRKPGIPAVVAGDKRAARALCRATWRWSASASRDRGCVARLVADAEPARALRELDCGRRAAAFLAAPECDSGRRPALRRALRLGAVAGLPTRSRSGSP